MKTSTWNIILSFAWTQTATEIADGSGFSRSTVVRYLDEMVKRGIVRKDSSTGNYTALVTNDIVDIVRGTAA